MAVWPSTPRRCWSIAPPGRDVQRARVTREASMAKLHATEARAGHRRRGQLFGGLGVVQGVVVERLYREIRALRIYEGASEVLELIIGARARWRRRRRSSVRERGATTRFTRRAARAARAFGALGRWLAWRLPAGGGARRALVFVALVAMSIVSISRHKLFSAPVPGDVELLQLCATFASSSFFAWCHLNHGDVKVDFFTERLPERAVACSTPWARLVATFGALPPAHRRRRGQRARGRRDHHDPRPAALWVGGR